MALKDAFAYVSAFIVLVPIALGLLKYKDATLVEKAVLFFLLLGFSVDVSYLYINVNYRKWILLCYSLAEAFFFYWILFTISDNRSAKKLCRLLMFFTPVLWILQLSFLKNDAGNLAFFDMFYNMTTAFLSSFSILFMIEKISEPFKNSLFWILAAIFFYGMCSFFIVVFINNPIAKQIWYLHNVVNILTSLLFAKAFLLIKKSKVEMPIVL